MEQTPTGKGFPTEMRPTASRSLSPSMHLPKMPARMASGGTSTQQPMPCCKVLSGDFWGGVRSRPEYKEHPLIILTGRGLPGAFVYGASHVLQFDSSMVNLLCCIINIDTDTDTLGSYQEFT